MPDFHLVPHPVFRPTRCTTCHAGRCTEGFIDLLIDGESVHGYDEAGVPVVRDDGEPYFGHLYLCVMCLKQAATRIGWASAQHATDAYAENETLLARILELEQQLETEQARPLQVVGAADVVNTMLERVATG